MIEYKCQHVRDGFMPAITRVSHRAIPGAPTRADNLETVTELCAMCSGTIVGTLMQLEKRAVTAITEDVKQPDGSHAPGDNVVLDVRIIALKERGVVGVDFAKPIEWIGLDKASALSLGMLLIKTAEQLP